MSDRPETTPEVLAQAGKAERARIRAALKREKARLLRQMADCEERAAEVDEKLATLLLSKEGAVDE